MHIIFKDMAVSKFTESELIQIIFRLSYNLLFHYIYLQN